MLVALLTDIHGNREALAACLAHAAKNNVVRYVFLGDLVGYGADPGWVVDEVRAYVERGASVIMGNHDAAVLTGPRGMNPVAAAAIEWTSAQLDADQRAFLRQLPMWIEDGERLFVHANAWAPADWGYIFSIREAAWSIEATPFARTFCGHVHVPVLYSMDAAGKISGFTPVAGVGVPLRPERRWLAVIGAVGQPRDRNPAACYALLDDQREVLTYVRVPYDSARAAQKILAAGLPPVLATRLGEGY
jgi:diadenosine tetraphosphatase ApaH/serine/threonine PP2A family protein phosphatase